MPLLWLILILLGAGIVLTGAILLLTARLILMPPRMTDAKALKLLRRLTPEDLGLAYERMDFVMRDHQRGQLLKIAGWWMPHPAAQGRCVILIHGYADAKVGSIAWTPLWHALGYNTLAIDLRAHGDSQGVHCTAGFFERYDLKTVVNELRAARPGESERIVLFGISMGAAVAVAAACEIEGLAGLVLDSCFADYQDALRSHIDLMGLPLPTLAPVATYLAERISGARFRAVSPMRLISKVPCPVLLLFTAEDPYCSESQAADLLAAARKRTGILTETCRFSAGHALALAREPVEYRRCIQRFLDRSEAKSP